MSRSVLSDLKTRAVGKSYKCDKSRTTSILTGSKSSAPCELIYKVVFKSAPKSMPLEPPLRLWTFHSPATRGVTRRVPALVTLDGGLKGGRITQITKCQQHFDEHFRERLYYFIFVIILITQKYSFVKHNTAYHHIPFRKYEASNATVLPTT